MKLPKENEDNDSDTERGERDVDQSDEPQTDSKVESPKSKTKNEIYCRSCGEIIKKEAEICPHCGVRNDESTSTSEGGDEGAEDTIDDIAPYVAWIFGIIFVLIGVDDVGAVLEPGIESLRTAISGGISVLIGTFALPPIREKIEEATELEIERWVAILVVILGLVLIELVNPGTPTDGIDEGTQIALAIGLLLS
ncbi:MAG: zinc ribbon domain-containing protein [Halobacteria archaeon]|nr:zinc ribbon domain-containing protein [Halobacteria archaeon]